MSEGDLNFLGQADWRKQLYPLKQEQRSNTPETREVLEMESVFSANKQSGLPTHWKPAHLGERDDDFY